MKNEERKFKAYVFGGEGGSRREMLKCTSGRNEKLPKHNYEIELDPNLVDVVSHGDLTYRIFWNKKYFDSQDSLKGLLSGDTTPALIVVNDYEPMVVRAEVIDDADIGFTAYRSDGKAMISGEMTVYEDHFKLRFGPVYRRVQLGCRCAHTGGAQGSPPAQAGPRSPGDR